MASIVNKAVVLAAGYGKRLKPFTGATPKPLMPVWGEPMIERIVGLLRSRGVDDIVVNAHHLSDQIVAWVEEYRAKAEAAGERVSMRVSFEPEILGSGGALDPLREWIGEDPFYLVNGDVVVENVPELPVPSGEAIGTCLVTELGPRTIEVEPEYGYVTNWKSDDSGYDGTFTYCGFALLSPDILRYVPKGAFSSIVEAYEKAMMDARFMKTVVSSELLWEDAGDVGRYIDLNRDGEDNAFADIPQLKAAGGAEKVVFLGARGSDRVFFWLDGDRVAVLYDDEKRGENARYAGHARWLRAKGIPVPEIIFDDPAIKTTVLEDVGVEKRMSFENYVEVVGSLVKFNSLGACFTAEKAGDDAPIELEPRFDAAMWKWERELFREHCLGTRFHREMSAAVERELEAVAARLEAEPTALVHRDFQSTNILWRNGRHAFIDFQGMRLGPAVYDLASLVYDPYVTTLSAREREALVTLYAKTSGRAETLDVLPFAAVQRLVQCLGAFGRLASVGQPGFARHTLPALVNLLEAADNASLDAVGALAEDLIAIEKDAK